MTQAAQGPVFSDLSRDECEALLSRLSIGRLAFVFRDRVDVEPIHFVFDNGRIFFRTAPGSKLTTLLHHPWVALEVDDVRGMFDWRSVVVHGTVYLLSEAGSDADKAAYRDALRALRRVLPETLRAGDPFAFRDIVVELGIDTITGRAAGSA
jgi:nitroimidazol reductase NimA-like FMN-containing flavoprotein (pyridoxamine 5'-phosphate oxidase superfamily)